MPDEVFSEAEMTNGTYEGDSIHQKSEEHDDQIAPIFAELRKATIVSGIFGRTAAILSFDFILFFFKK